MCSSEQIHLLVPEAHFIANFLKSVEVEAVEDLVAEAEEVVMEVEVEVEEGEFLSNPITCFYVAD